jgi:hypothetical protein
MKNGTDLLASMGQNMANKRAGMPQTPIRHGQPQNIPQVPRPGTMPTAIEDVPGSADDNLLNAAPAASTVQDEPTIAAPSPDGTVADVTAADGQAAPGTPVEPGGSRNVLPGWTTESALAEMRKARDEAKRSRLEMKDTVDRLQKEYERKLNEIKSATKPLEDQARELADLRAKEADKKRSLEERIAVRDAALAEKDEEIRALQDAHEKEFAKFQAELENLRSEVNVQNQFYEDKLAEELTTIPEKYRVSAERLVKGCDNAREAYEAIREEKAKGLFKDKTIQVSHAVPSADQGARVSGNVQTQAQRESIKKMSSTQKIGLALESIKQNPIYRGRG